MKYIPSLFFLFIVACNSPKTETTKVPFAQTLKLQGKSAFGIVDQNGDTLIVTSKDTTISWTYAIYDTTWRRKGTTPPIDTTKPPPVDTIPVPPNPPAGGLTGYGTIISYTPFTSLDKNQLGNGKLIANPDGSKDTVFSAIVNQGDAAISSGWRSEQNWSTTPSEGGIEFDIQFVKVYTQNSLILQIHGGTSGTSGPVSIWPSGSSGLQVVTSDERHNNKYYSIPNFSYSLNRWYHFRIEFKLADPGYFRVIIDGSQKINITGKMNDVAGQYGKIGVNLFRNDNGTTAPGSMNVLYNSFYIFKK